MNIKWIFTLVIAAFVGVAAAETDGKAGVTLEPMPADLETRFALSAMPHLMFYAPYVTNEDIGAKPDLGDPASLLYPFIGRQGNDEQSYMIHLIGEAEKARILAAEKAMLDDLCAWREVLCLAHTKQGEST